jgi:hypothetical protein
MCLIDIALILLRFALRLIEIDFSDIETSTIKGTIGLLLLLLLLNCLLKILLKHTLQIISDLDELDPIISVAAIDSLFLLLKLLRLLTILCKELANAVGIVTIQLVIIGEAQ